MKKQIIVTTSWDDGHKMDLRLAKLLKKYKVAGTFYISKSEVEFGKNSLLTEVDIKNLSNNFEIGAHTMKHNHLNGVSAKKAEREIKDSKLYLEKLTGKSVNSFCYPYGEYNQQVSAIVKEAGFKISRTVERFKTEIGTDKFSLPTTVHAYTHFKDVGNPIVIAKYKTNDWEILAKKQFDSVLKKGGVFHLWGHSWEIDKHNDWEKLERVLKYISNKKNAEYLSNSKIVEEKRKILFVTPYFYPSTGGLENYALNIAKGLSKNTDVIVVTSNYKKRKKLEIINGIKIYRLPVWFKISNTPINPMWYFEIKKIIKEEKPDLINAHAPVPFIADIAALTSGKIPFVLTYHTGSMKKNKLFIDTLVYMYEKYFIKYAISKSVFIICSSSFVKNFLKDKHLEKKAFIVNPGVTAENIIKNKKMENNILFVGGLGKAEKHKGLEYLINAVKIVKESLPNTKLIVVGNGNALPEYKKTISRLDLTGSTTFTGELNTDKLNGIYNKSNLLVLPSFNESFGTVLIEAMARKLPVIGSNIGGIPEIIDDNKNGFLVKPKKIEELAEKIIKVLKNKKLAKRFGDNGYRKVQKKYLWEFKIKETEKVFNQILYEK